MKNYPADTIQVLETWEAIRKRPRMYVGELDEGLPNRLLQEALCMARAAALRGEGAEELRIEVGAQGRAVLRDDGPGWNVTLGPMGRRMAELFLRELFGCREAKDAEHRGLCNTGVVTLVAMCSEFEFTTWREGQRWTQSFRDGRATTGFVGEPSEGRGTVMAFRLDGTLLPHVEFDFEGLEVFRRELVSEGLQVELVRGH